jgi:hypothetical protein
VNDDDLSRLVAVRVGVLFGWPTVRRPTGMADAVRAVERMQTNAFFQIAQLPFRTPQLKMMLFVRDRDAGRIVTAILEFS